MAEYRFRPIHADHSTDVETTWASSHLVGRYWPLDARMVRKVDQAIEVEIHR